MRFPLNRPAITVFGGRSLLNDEVHVSHGHALVNPIHAELLFQLKEILLSS